MVSINEKKAIKVIEDNLKKSKTETLLSLNYDLENDKSLGSSKLDIQKGKELVNKSKTFVLNEDEEEFPVSTLAIYTEKQKDIYNIVPVGKKHEVLLLPKEI